MLGATLLTIAGLSLLLWAAARAVLRGREAGNGSGLAERFDYDLAKYKKIDPALIGYRQTGEIRTAMRQARAVALGPADRIYVAGDKVIRVFEPDGEPHAEIAVEEEPGCLAVAGADLASPGLIYVGFTRHLDVPPGDKKAVHSRGHVEVYQPDGTRRASWEPIDRAVLTSVAAAEAGVFVADAGNRVVVHYDASGKRLGAIDGRNRETGGPGFVIPSPYFDVAMAPDGLLRVVNPGAHRIEAYTVDGHREAFWGEAGLQIERFCGCCNPAHFTVMADGRYVTAEKGVPRVKVYSPDGYFQCAVVGPEVLAPTATVIEETRAEHKLNAVDVAADSRGRVLVLDPAAGCVRIFEPKKNAAHD